MKEYVLRPPVYRVVQYSHDIKVGELDGLRLKRSGKDAWVVDRTGKTRRVYPGNFIVKDVMGRVLIIGTEAEFNALYEPAPKPEEDPESTPDTETEPEVTQDPEPKAAPKKQTAKKTEKPQNGK